MHTQTILKAHRLEALRMVKGWIKSYRSTINTLRKQEKRSYLTDAQLNQRLRECINQVDDRHLCWIVPLVLCGHLYARWEPEIPTLAFGFTMKFDTSVPKE